MELDEGGWERREMRDCGRRRRRMNDRSGASAKSFRRKTVVH